RVAIAVTVTPVTTADTGEAFAIDPASARPWFGSEELTVKLSEMQTLTEVSRAGADAILQLPAQVQKFQQQFTALLAPFKVSGLTDGGQQAASFSAETLNGARSAVNCC